MQIRLRIPELVLGALLMLAAISIILVISSSNNATGRFSAAPTQIEPRDPKDHSAVPSAEGAGSERSPVFVRIQKSEKEAADEKQDREKKTFTDWLLATYTGLLFLATLGLMVATVGLWYFAIKQSGDMRKSLAIASKSANAAKSSADVARRAFTQIERPYVFVAGISGLLTSDEPGGRLQVSFGISNLGRTPAFISDLWAELFILSNPIPTSVSNLFFSNTVHKMGDVLASGEKIDDIVCFMRTGATQKLEDIRNRDTYLIFKAAGLYADIFGNQHHSNFHWLYDPDRDYFSSYAAGNCNSYD
jgi:hypothetical protein